MRVNSPSIGSVAKAWKGLAAGAALLAAAGSGMAFANAQGLLGGAAAEEAAADSDALRAEAERRAEEIAFTEVYVRQRACEFTVENGETFAGLLERAGVPRVDQQAAIASLSDVFNTRALRPGLPIKLVFEEGDEARLTGLSFRSNPGESITANRTAGGPFTARQVLTPVTYEIARIAAPVEGSLYASALALGATDNEIAALADAFAYDVDFQRDIRPGDRFEIVFERFYDDEGQTVRTGDMLFVSLEARTGARAFYRFQAPGDVRSDWYDSEGKSARKFLMKTPINGARLSSGFGMRMHPILGFSRMHRGADFSARTGTPVMAAGDGVVVRAGPYGAYGNYVRIRHANGYETAYAHLSRFGRGMRAGLRMRQGQILGYVGSTGRSTGPHLHYEVLRGGNQVNPMSLRVATGRNLAARDLELFKAERTRIDTLRLARANENGMPVSEAARGRSAGGGAPGMH
jgi:murein DD-endopeptidase MepM/ murein hydrolase activator NlpD